MSRHQRRLALALLVSMLLHGVLLSVIHVKGPALTKAPQPLFLDFAPMASETTVSDTPALKHEEAVQAERPRVSRHPRTPKRPAAGPSTGPAPIAQPQPSQGPATVEDLRSKSLQMARRETVDPFAGQRLRALSPQTRDSVFGPYEEAYRQKVEQVGRVNYPPPVEGRSLYGTVRITATIRQDGSLALIEIRQPSGSAYLDDAARRIIQMAAPFQPFTDAMRAEADLVSITRSFNFVRAGEGVTLK